MVGERQLGGASMTGRLFESSGAPRAERLLVKTVTLAIYDRGRPAARGERYEAELGGFAVVRGVGLVAVGGGARARRWTPGAARSALVFGKSVVVTGALRPRGNDLEAESL
jgi:hypothetical protein